MSPEQLRELVSTFKTYSASPTALSVKLKNDGAIDRKQTNRAALKSKLDLL